MRYEAREIPERKVELSNGYIVIAKTWGVWDNNINDYMRTVDGKSYWTNGPRIAKQIAEWGNETEEKKNE